MSDTTREMCCEPRCSQYAREHYPDEPKTRGATEYHRYHRFHMGREVIPAFIAGWEARGQQPVTVSDEMVLRGLREWWETQNPGRDLEDVSQSERQTMRRILEAALSVQRGEKQDG